MLELRSGTSFTTTDGKPNRQPAQIIHEQSHAIGLAVLLLCLIVTAAPVTASTWITVYLAHSNTEILTADPNIPHVYPEIMAGTELTLILSSDEPGPGDHQLLISEKQWPQGQLFGRGYDEKTRDYTESHTQESGLHTKVTASQGYADLPDGKSVIDGFSISTSFFAIPGPWMILDYTAYDPGEMLLHYRAIPNGLPPLQYLYALIFPQVPTRDFNQDTVVTFHDFSIMAQQWGESLTYANDFDLDEDLNIGNSDLHEFSRFWLEQTRGTDPNSPNVETVRAALP